MEREDIIKFNNKNYIIIDIMDYEEKKYLFLNVLDENNEMTEEAKIVNLVSGGILEITEELNEKLLAMFIKRSLELIKSEDEK